MEDTPFPDLKITDYSFLNLTNKRRDCPSCGKSRKYYCYTCYVPVDKDMASRIPKIKLPVKIDIIKHPSECDGKSTSSHAAVLAQDKVTIYTYPCIPNYDRDKTILIFPGNDAVELSTLFSDNHTEIIKSSRSHSITDLTNDKDADDCKFNVTVGEKREYKTAFDEHQKATIKKNDNKSHFNKPWFDKVIFIDSTWNQTNTISKDERLKDIQRVELKQRKTKFWRNHAGNPEEYLSTIEAIYYFICDYHKLWVNSCYDGEYDNLLFFFSFTYSQIHKSSNGGKHLKAYIKRQKTK